MYLTIGESFQKYFCHTIKNNGVGLGKYRGPHVRKRMSYRFAILFAYYYPEIKLIVHSLLTLQGDLQ